MRPNHDVVSPASFRGRLARWSQLAGRLLTQAGVVVLLFIGFQIWGTGIHEARSQSLLRERFLDDLGPLYDELGSTDVPQGGPSVAGKGLSSGAGQAGDQSVGSVSRSSLARTDNEVEPGEPVAIIEVPAIGVSKIVVSGTAIGDLRRGPGHYRETAPLGGLGNAAIAGHRTTYGAPFRRIDELVIGDTIELTTMAGTFRYRVMDPEAAFDERSDRVVSFQGGHAIVAPTALWVLSDFGDNRLTLTACHPEYSSAERIVVVAELTDDGDLNDLNGIAEPGVAGPIEEDSSSRVSASLPASIALSDVDAVLAGDRSALVPTLWWLAVAGLIWNLGSWWMDRRTAHLPRRIAGRVVLLAPTLGVLWFAFGALERVLPGL